MPGPDNQYSTVLEALDAAAGRGFVRHFSFRNGMMICEETGELFSADDLLIEEFHRFEGNSDPDESAIVYLLASKTGVKGTLLDSYGAQSDGALADFLSSIPIDRSETRKPAPRKYCLNCGAELQGPYCAECGQKDEHLREPFWKMAGHFIGDFFHFDSRFTRTFLPLLFRPGFLTKEFVSGRRARYMKPIQLYIFISLTFFLFYFSFSKPPDTDGDSVIVEDSMAATELMDDSTLAKQLEMVPYLAQPVKDSIMAKVREKRNADSLRRTEYTAKENRDDGKLELGEAGGLNFTLDEGDNLPATVEEYVDSINRLPADQRPPWYLVLLTKRQIELEERARKDPQEVFHDLFESFTHGIPKLVFILLPLFALILKLFYLRSNVYFVDHAVFSLHYHSFVFLIFLIVFLTGMIFPGLIGPWPVFLVAVIYLVMALHLLHHQSWMRTILKTTGILFLYFIVMVFVGAFGLLYAVFTA